MVELMRRILQDRRGATAVEYGLIAALLALVIVSGAGGIGETVSAQFNNVADAFQP